MPKILTSTSTTELWQDLVREGEDRAHAKLNEEIESYLVFTLMRHFRDIPLAHRVIAFELLEALQHSGKVREQELRDVGDHCLLIAGFYPELSKRRHVPLNYFIGLGQSAYDELSHQLRAALSAMYAHLAKTFADLVRVLVEVRSISGEWHLDAMNQYQLAVDSGAANMLDDPHFHGAILLQGSKSKM